MVFELAAPAQRLTTAQAWAITAVPFALKRLDAHQNPVSMEERVKLVKQHRNENIGRKPGIATKYKFEKKNGTGRLV